MCVCVCNYYYYYLQADANRFDERVLREDDLCAGYHRRAENSAGWTESSTVDTDSCHDGQVLRQIGQQDALHGHVKQLLGALQLCTVINHRRQVCF